MNLSKNLAAGLVVFDPSSTLTKVTVGKAQPPDAAAVTYPPGGS
jgi:hypothetical protein